VTPLRVGVLKPDWGVAGGFERLLDRLLVHLNDVGHDVTVERFPGLITPRASWDTPAALDHWSAHPEFFRYFSLLEDVRRLDLDSYDLVISTQPPTYLADHPRVLALFYHHARIFYDLRDPFLRLGDIEPHVHRMASEVVRATDAEMIGGVRHWLAGSDEVRNRLAEYWGVSDHVSLLHAPPLAEAPTDPPPWNPAGPVVCVSRHEWPKRTEFVIAAAQLLAERRVELIGGGGQLANVRALDARLTRSPHLVADVDALWMHPVRQAQPFGPSDPSTAFVLGAVSDERRNRAYADASVVVAPAHREDYGLTALEAMQWQRPLIVCSDGGGLVDIVNDTGAGLIVDPNPEAIAAGVRQIVDDQALATELIDRCRGVPAAYNWARCHRELDAAVDAAMSSSDHVN
jgi:glycosyltransferase involved in cell wall biosynthesis